MSKIIKVYIELTFKCNLKCKFCYVWEMQEEENYKHHLLDVGDDFLYQNIDAIFHEGKYTYDVDILGWESTLNKNIIKILSYITTRNSIRRLTLTTNATFLSQQLLTELKNSGVDEFRVSLHWLESTHNAIVWRDVFQKVIHSLGIFKELFIPYTLVFVVNNINKFDILPLIEFLDSKKILPEWLFFEFVEFSWYAHRNISELNLVYDKAFVVYFNKTLHSIQIQYPRLGFIVTNYPKCVLDVDFHSIIDDGYFDSHRYELYYPYLARKSLFWFSFNEQRELIKKNIERGYKINFQKKLQDEFIPDECFTCKYNKNCYLLSKETILHEYLQKDFLKRKQYFEINKKILPWK